MSTPTQQPVAGESTSLIVRTFGQPRFRTDNDIAALAYDTDGRLWSVEEPGVLRSWDDNGRPTGRYFLIDLETSWAFSPQAKLLAAACDELIVWEVATRQMLARIEVPSWVTSIAFHPSQILVATGHDDGVVRLWNPAEEELVAELSEHSLAVSALAFDADGNRLVSAGEDRVIKVWDVASRKLIRDMPGHTDRIPCIAWHPKGQFVVSVGWDATARVWDVAKGEPRILLNTHDDQVQVLAFSTDGSMLATSDSASIVHVWGDLLTAQALHRLEGYADEVRALAFRNDGRRLAVGGSDREIHIYDPQSGQLVVGRAGDTSHSIALWNDAGQTWLVSNSVDEGLNIWDLNSGSERTSPLPPKHYLHVASSPDGRWLAGATAEAKIYAWDAKSKVVKTIDGPRSAPTLLQFLPDSTVLSSAVKTEGTVWLWNLETLEPSLIVIEATEGCSVETITWHPNSKWLLCGGVDFLSTSGSSGTVCLWDVPDKKKLQSIPSGATCSTFDATAQTFALGTPDGWVHVIATESGDPILELEGPEEERVSAITFSQDGGWLIGSGADGLLRVWDTSTGDLLSARDLSCGVDNMIRLNDGRLLVAFENGTVGEILINRLVSAS